MQTFLPYRGLYGSARCLDPKRLGKQRLEVVQIHNALRKLRKGERGGWQRHPAVLMWEGCEYALLLYGLMCCDEWEKRGYRSSLTEEIERRLEEGRHGEAGNSPWWLGREEFHSSHRAALLAKDPEWYGRFGWEEEAKVDYWWPTKHKGG